MLRGVLGAVGAAGLLLSGCSDTSATVTMRDGTDPTSATSDRQADALSAVPQLPHRAVCSGGTFHCKARARTLSDGKTLQMAALSGLQGYAPSDLASAYGLNTSVNPGATIAVVDAYGYPNVDSDLATYRSTFGLPPCTLSNGCLKVVNQNGQTSPLPAAPSASDDWTIETALDLSMASAACPNCKLLLVQANDDTSDGLFYAQQAAVNLGATVVSNSWGGPDTAHQGPSLEQYFNHPGVGVFVASGDQGYDDQDAPVGDYPSTSAYVTAVGGTSLVKSSTPRGWTEGVWGPYNSFTGGGGSSCSQDIPKPSWQTNTVCNFRAASDVSAVADPNTGVAVYNSGPSGSGWLVVGGTSAATPFVAGVYVMTGHAAAGPSFSYANGKDFYDVTTGSNDTCGTILCNAGPGWDGPTGNGSPNGSALAGASCTPQCSGKQCGSNGCGGSCGTCASGETCDASGQCVTSCTPSCSGKQCGSDGCGGSCGSCPSGDTCNASGQCVASCTPSCSGKQCGGDGCGGSCGSCPSGDTCNSSGQCVGGSSCGHALCSTGGALTPSCDPCASTLCAQDPYCCSVAWDSICVSEVTSICGESCGSGTCLHSICSTGKHLKASCDPCAADICSLDPYCCLVKWDAQCVGEVSWICGESC